MREDIVAVVKERLTSKQIDWGWTEILIGTQTWRLSTVGKWYSIVFHAISTYVADGETLILHQANDLGNHRLPLRRKMSQFLWLEI